MSKARRRESMALARRTEHDQKRTRRHSGLERSSGRAPVRPIPDPEDERLLAELRTHRVVRELQDEELRTTQTELLSARDHLADLYERAPVGYVSTDLDGVILAANLRCATLLGQKRQRLVGRALFEFVEREDRDVYCLHLQALRQGAVRRACELRMRRMSGELFWVALESVLLQERGTVQVRSAMSEVTDRKRNEEEQLRLRERLQHLQKMESIGTLAGGVAHDVNNILTVVLALASRLERGMPADDRRCQDVRDIVSAVFRGKKLTQDLLDFAHKGPQRKELCHPNDTVGRLLGVLQRTAPKRIALKPVLDPEVGWVECDPDRLMQMLMTACVNSIDAITNHGTITLRTRNVLPGAEELADAPELPAAAHVCIEIADDGCGMDDETQRRAFEPFFTTKDVGKGTGLGLPLVYATVRELGGAVRMTSKVGSGTSLCILLRAQPPGRARRSWIPDRTVSVPGGTVLVVDDEPLVRLAFTRTLEDLGYEVIGADSGDSALKAYQAGAGRIDLVLLDMSMPKMGGAECNARLRELDANVRVVFCTGHSRAEAVQALGAESALTVVTKPCTSEELAAALANSLGKPMGRPGEPT